MSHGPLAQPPGEHLDEDLLRRWRGRALSKHEVLAMTEHLEACPGCSARLGAMAVFADPLPRLAGELAILLDPEEAHPADDELESLVYRSLVPADLARLSAHVRDCQRCRAIVQDLRAFVAADQRPATASRAARWMAAAAVLFLAVLAGWGLLARRAAPRSAESAHISHRPPVTVAAGPSHPLSTPARGAAARVEVLQDGDRELRVYADGTIEGVPDRWRQQITEVVRNPTFDLPGAILALAPPGYPERGESSGDGGGGTTIRLLVPVRVVTLETRPIFRWEAARDGTYEVEVFDPEFRRVAASGTVQGETWRPEESLPRGEPLTWKLTRIAGPDGLDEMFPRPTEAPAVFMVAGREVSEEVAAARKSGSRLVAGITLWRSGLLADASAELAALARENPQSAFAARLAASSEHSLHQLAIR